MAEKLKETLKIVGVSLITAIAVKHINIDWGFIGGVFANDIAKGIFAFAAGAIVVLIITRLTTRRRG